MKAYEEEASDLKAYQRRDLFQILTTIKPTKPLPDAKSGRASGSEAFITHVERACGVRLRQRRRRHGRYPIPCP